MKKYIINGVIYTAAALLIILLIYKKSWILLCILTVMLAASFLRHTVSNRSYFSEAAKISEILEELLQNKTVIYNIPKDDTLYAKILSQIQRIDEINRSNLKLLETERDSIKNLLAEVAHQLRTPLANMETYIALLEDTPCSETERAGYISSIESAEQKISFLVEAFITAARMENGIIQIRKRRTDLKETVAEAVFQVYKKASEKNINIEVTEDNSLNKTVLHDKNWICESIYNLLDNSIKYSPKDSSITVFITDNEMFTEIRVEDFGIGINDGDENKIFQRFYRGDNASGTEGHGMGLYIAREIIKKHDGYMNVKRKNQGLIMSIFLPKTET